METSPALSAHSTSGEHAWWLEHFLAAERVFFLYIEAGGQAEVCGPCETLVSSRTGRTEELRAPGDTVPLTPGRTSPHGRPAHSWGRSARRPARRSVHVVRV
jgi:hypothetical protein